MSKKSAVLITGAAKRVGRALSLSLAKQGYDIAIHYHTSQKEAENLKAEVEALGVKAECFQQDLNAMPELSKFIEKVLAVMPHCRVLINNASVFERAMFLESDGKMYERMMRINAEVPIFLTQAFALKAERGHVINMLDTHVKGNIGSHFFYLLAKKNLRDFTEMAAVALGPDVRVNAVCPGVVLPSQDEDAAYMQRLATRLPMRTIANPQAVCNAVSWLLMSEAVTGQCIHVDGGEHLL